MILQRLRTETAPHHSALESRLPLMDPQLTRGQYRQLLESFYGYYEPLEARLMASPFWEPIGVDYGERRKLPRLEKDLHQMGATPERCREMPRCHALPDLGTPEQVLGTLYVIEGATLGGRIISGHLRTHLGLEPESGAAFFAGYESETGPRWQAFGEKLKAFTKEKGGDDAIIAAANRTFETMASWLYPCPAPVSPSP